MDKIAPSLVLVENLRRTPWAELQLSRISREEVLRAVPIPDYTPESFRGLEYDAGRVRWMLDLLVRGHELDPISIDLDEGEVEISDGNHRFVAHVLAGRPTIAAWIAGPEKEIGRWELPADPSSD